MLKHMYSTFCKCPCIYLPPHQPEDMADSSSDLPVPNEHTARYLTLHKAWQKRNNGKSNTEFWDYLKPDLDYVGVQPGHAPPPGAQPVAVVLVGIGCNKRLSAKNPSDTGKNHKNCARCKQVGLCAFSGGGAQLPLANCQGGYMCALNFRVVWCATSSLLCWTAVQSCMFARTHLCYVPFN